MEIEVDTLAQLDEAIAAGAERILLDNMDDETLKEAANRCHTQTAHPHTVYCEASGGIGFDRLKRVAQTDVDGIGPRLSDPQQPLVGYRLGFRGLNFEFAIKQRPSEFQTAFNITYQPNVTISICSILLPKKRSPMVRKRSGMSLT